MHLGLKERGRPLTKHGYFSAFLRVFIQKSGWMLPTLYKLLNELRELAALVCICVSRWTFQVDTHKTIFLREILSWIARERHRLVVKTPRGCVTKRLQVA